MAHFEVRLQDLDTKKRLEYLGIEEFKTLDNAFEYLEDKHKLKLEKWKDRGFNTDIILTKINFVEFRRDEQEKTTKYPIII